LDIAAPDIIFYRFLAMSFPRLSLALAIAAAFLVVQGCETTAEKLPPPKTTVTLVLTPDKRQEISSLPFGSALKIVLPVPSQGSGYSWEVTSNNDKVLKQTSPIKADKGADGNTVSYSVVFQSLRPSPPRSIVTLAAVRAGSPESQATDVYQIAVGVKAAQ
jgi:hypothetical protein